MDDWVDALMLRVRMSEKTVPWHTIIEQEIWLSQRSLVHRIWDRTGMTVLFSIHARGVTLDDRVGQFTMRLERDCPMPETLHLLRLILGRSSMPIIVESPCVKSTWLLEALHAQCVQHDAVAGECACIWMKCHATHYRMHGCTLHTRPMRSLQYLATKAWARQYVDQVEPWSPVVERLLIQVPE